MHFKKIFECKGLTILSIVRGPLNIFAQYCKFRKLEEEYILVRASKSE